MDLEHLLSKEQLGLFLFFVVPGLIILRARGLFVNNRGRPLTDIMMSYVVLSLIYQACIFPATQWAANLQGTWGWVIWIFGLFVIPAAVGFLFGLSGRSQWLRNPLALLGINVGHPIDAAWDYRFAGCEPCWVHIVLKDGTKWAGHLGEGSFISTDPSERDLYLDGVHRVGEDEVWSRAGSSLWLAHGEIQSIEFWPQNQEQSHGD